MSNGELTLPRLCDRVAAPALPELDHPDVAEWRPATLADVDAVTSATKAMDAVDHPDWTTPREDIEDDFDSDHLSLAVDSLLALNADGEVLAWGLVDVNPDLGERAQAYLSGGVVPRLRGRGIGQVLLQWQIARATQRFAGLEAAVPAWVRLGVDERNPAGVALARSLGMRVERYFTTMERDLRVETSSAVEPVRAPPGVRLVRYTPDRAEEARLARNDAFRDHWGSLPTPPQRWQQFVAGELFRADLSWLALDEDGEVLGFALVTANEEDWELQGYTSSYLGILGVVREARRRGIAPALMAAYLTATKEAGLDAAILDVDTANPTGALGLYERAGFVATNRSLELVLEV